MIVNRFIFLIFVLGYLPSVLAAQWATVLSDRAVIFSDQAMQSPIGYIRKGKRIRVGEKVRSNGMLLPVVISGKIAYIKVDDINSNTKLTQLQSATERLKSGKKSEFEKRISLIYAGYASVISIDEESSYSGDTYDGKIFYFNGGGLRGYTTNINTNTTWRLTFDYGTTLVEKNKYDLLNLAAEYSYNIIQVSNYDLRLYGGALIIPYAQYSYDDLFTVNGYGAGASVGLEMVFKIIDGIGFHIDGGYTYSKLFFRLPTQTLIDKHEPSFHGAKFTAGLSFAF